ncbi:Uncharacterised protein [uncultured archaeon]|nr:Uncharacterised protein [uncultured archaeon]
MKTSVLLVILVAVALATAWFIFSKPAYPLTQQDAEKFFLEDLQGRYPSADVREVTDIRPLSTPEGAPYFQLEARVTNGMSTPCPERIHVYYDYPPKNFVAQPPEYITKGCKVCLNVDVCVLAYPEEAIIASHTYNGTGAVAQFIRDNADARAEAVYTETYGNFTGGLWNVAWSTASGLNGYRVILSKNQNKVLEVMEITTPPQI